MSRTTTFDHELIVQPHKVPRARILGKICGVVSLTTSRRTHAVLLHRSHRLGDTNSILPATVYPAGNEQIQRVITCDGLLFDENMK